MSASFLGAAWNKGARLPRLGFTSSRCFIIFAPTAFKGWASSFKKGWPFYTSRLSSCGSFIPPGYPGVALLYLQVIQGWLFYTSRLSKGGSFITFRWYQGCLFYNLRARGSVLVCLHVCVCVCVCVWVCVRICAIIPLSQSCWKWPSIDTCYIHTCIHTCIYVIYMPLLQRSRRWRHNACMHTSIQLRVGSFEHIYRCIHACIHVSSLSTHARTHARTHKHIYIYTHTQTL